jgi:hypothetical protein
MGQLIADFLRTPEPSEVWHYTNMVSFDGIISSGKMWATEVHHMTDTTEFVHARDVALNYMSRLNTSNHNQARAKQTCLEILDREFENGILSPSKIEIFSISFCAVSNLETQWKNYADNGRGVSISFDLRRVRPPEASGYLVTYAPCIYETDQKERLLDDALADWRHTFFELLEKTGSVEWVAERKHYWSLVDHVYGFAFDRNKFETWNNEAMHVWLYESLTRTLADLLRIASHCKNPSYAQEAEWRLALPHEKGRTFSNQEILYRGDNNSVPYIEHNLFSNKLPIVRVKAGPACEHKDYIIDLLSSSGYDVPVE